MTKEEAEKAEEVEKQNQVARRRSVYSLTVLYVKNIASDLLVLISFNVCFSSSLSVHAPLVCAHHIIEEGFFF